MSGCEAAAAIAAATIWKMAGAAACAAGAAADASGGSGLSVLISSAGFDGAAAKSVAFSGFSGGAWVFGTSFGPAGAESPSFFSFASV